MPSTEEQIQKTVLSLEAGQLAKWVWRAVLVAVGVALTWYFVEGEFRGLPLSESMDQAQIGRELVRGNGFATKMIRPLAIGELARHGRDPKSDIWKDTYEAPLACVLDAIALWVPVHHPNWDLTRHDFVYAGDRAIAFMGVLFFLGALVVQYFIVKELFDERLAMITVWLVILTDMMWQYAIAGLPLMFILLMLHLAVYGVLRAMRAYSTNGQHLWWLAGAAAAFGLMALAHAMTLFIFVPALIFCAVYFRQRPWTAPMMFMIVAAMYAPWLVRNDRVCGDFGGMARFSIYDGIVHSESGHMRRPSLDLSDTSGNYYAENFRAHLTSELNLLFEYLGWSWVGPVAFVCALHPFRRPLTAAFRWLLFGMLGSAIIGMGIYGMKEEQNMAANQFFLLFMPLLTAYGMAYLLVQADRRIGLGFILPQWGDASRVHSFLRSSVVAVILLMTSVPLLLRIFTERVIFPMQWPPYAPGYIAVMKEWVKPKEIIGTDMPWAVAWYADRPALWLPYEQEELIQLKDYEGLGRPIVGLYLSPVSGTDNKMRDLVSGEYARWSGYILRTINPARTPFPFRTVLGMPDCALYLAEDRNVH